MKDYKVYKLTHSFGFFYVGVTTLPLWLRRRHHLDASKTSIRGKLYPFMKSTDSRDWEMKELEKMQGTRVEALLLEEKWIRKLHCDLSLNVFTVEDLKVTKEKRSAYKLKAWASEEGRKAMMENRDYNKIRDSQPSRIRLQCKETGRIYESISQLCKEEGFKHMGRICKRLKDNTSILIKGKEYKKYNS